MLLTDVLNHNDRSTQLNKMIKMYMDSKSIKVPQSTIKTISVARSPNWITIWKNAWE